MNNVMLWIGLFVVFLIAEIVSFQLIAIWFALSALITFFVSLFVHNPIVEGFLFVALSALFFLLFYPFAKKIYRPKADTNGEHIIGQEAIVIETIDPKNGKGQVKADGKEWSVKVKDSGAGCVEVGESVIIEAIEGVKLVVKYKDREVK